MTEVLNYGGRHHTRLREQLLCFGVPLPPYIKEGGGGGQPRRGAPIGGVQLGFPILVGVPFLFQEGERGKEVEREKEREGRHPLLVLLRPAMGGRGHPVALLSFSTKAH